MLCFAGFHLLFRMLKAMKYTKCLSNVFIKFRWISFIVVSLIGENLQYLSFRCFSQTFQLEAQSKTDVLNMVCCYTVLFIVLFYASAWFFILFRFPKAARTVVCDGFKVSVRTAVHSTCLYTLRVFTGAIHSRFSEHGTIQIAILTTVQIIILLLVILNRSIYKSKTYLACHVCEAIFRILLHISIFAELVFGYNKFEMLIQDAFDKNSETLFEIICFFCVIDIMISNFP